MRWLRSTGALVLCLVGFLTRPASAQTATCVAAADSSSIRLRTYIRTLVTSNDQSSVTVRTGLGLPVQDSTKVAVMSDSRVCAKILPVVNAAFKTPNVSRRLYVYTVGKNFAVLDGTVVVQDQGGAVVWMTSQYGFKDIVLTPSVY